MIAFRLFRFSPVLISRNDAAVKKIPCCFVRPFVLRRLWAAVVLPGLLSGADFAHHAFAQADEKPAVQHVPLPPETVLVRVNGKAITERDLTVMLLTRRVPPKLHAAVRNIFLERLIDHRLLRDYLEERKIHPTPEQLEAAVRRIHRQIRAQGGDPDKILRRYGLTGDLLRQELWLPVAWTLYARQIIPEKALQEEFEQHRQQYDGTQLRGRQILLRLSPDADEAARKRALEQLRQLRADITAGKISFAAAARRYSQAPSAREGGDVGFFSFRGKMPAVLTRVAFSLKKGEISQPFLTPFGAHLLQVTEVRPGQLSLEDVRPEIFRQLAQKKWDDIVQKLRKTARIERMKKPGRK